MTEPSMPSRAMALSDALELCDRADAAMRRTPRALVLISTDELRSLLAERERAVRADEREHCAAECDDFAAKWKALRVEYENDSKRSHFVADAVNEQNFWSMAAACIRSPTSTHEVPK